MDTGRLDLGEEAPVCEWTQTHPQAIEQVRGILPDEDTMLDVSELFKVLGDSTRCRILFVLLVSEMCVCDLSQMLSMSVSAVSHQLRILRQARLVRYRRQGKTIFYSLADEHVRTLLSQGMEHVQE
ncbi:MAG: helix-turn-helix transcriptional regulator [Clostridia bacterium]|nr:helix-turn-helix transcriptional regulator [Clostridia bacterium]